MINNIIFDFDGVLVDSEMLVAKSFSKYMNNLGYDFQEQYFAQFTGLKTFEVISILSKKFSIRDKKKFNEDIMNIVTNIYLKELEPVKGAFDFVKNCTLKRQTSRRFRGQLGNSSRAASNDSQKRTR